MAVELTRNSLSMSYWTCLVGIIDASIPLPRVSIKGKTSLRSNRYNVLYGSARVAAHETFLLPRLYYN